MVVQRRVTWDELKSIVEARQLERLGRLAEDEATYQQEKAARRAVFASVADTIYHVVFGFPCREVDGKRVAVVPRLASEVDPDAVEGVLIHASDMPQNPSPEYLAASLVQPLRQSVESLRASLGASASEVIIGLSGGSSDSNFGLSQSQGETFQSLGELRMVIWTKNEFPYALPREAEHHIVWSTYPLCPAEIRLVLDRFRHGYECLVFVNKPSLRSVKEIYHVHVFSRKPQGGESSALPSEPVVEK